MTYRCRHRCRPCGEEFSNKADLHHHRMLNHFLELPQGDPEQALAGDAPKLQKFKFKSDTPITLIK